MSAFDPKQTFIDLDNLYRVYSLIKGGSLMLRKIAFIKPTYVFLLYFIGLFCASIWAEYEIGKTSIEVIFIIAVPLFYLCWFTSALIFLKNISDELDFVHLKRLNQVVCFAILFFSLFIAIDIFIGIRSAPTSLSVLIGAIRIGGAVSVLLMFYTLGLFAEALVKTEIAMQKNSPGRVFTVFEAFGLPLFVWFLHRRLRILKDHLKTNPSN